MAVAIETMIHRREEETNHGDSFLSLADASEKLED